MNSFWHSSLINMGFFPILYIPIRVACFIFLTKKYIQLIFIVLTDLLLYLYVSSLRAGGSLSYL